MTISIRRTRRAAWLHSWRPGPAPHPSWSRRVRTPAEKFPNTRNVSRVDRAALYAVLADRIYYAWVLAQSRAAGMRQVGLPCFVRSPIARHRSLVPALLLRAIPASCYRAPATVQRTTRSRPASVPAFWPAARRTAGIARLGTSPAGLAAGVIGFIWLKLFGHTTAVDADTATMDFDVPEGAARHRKNAP